MEPRLSWCTIAILFVLLFVTSEALRGHNSQVDEQRSQTFGNRGTARFDAKSVDNLETSSVTSLSRSRSNRERKTETRRVSNNDRPVSRNVDNAKESFGSRDRSIVSDKKINPEEQLNDSRQRSSKRNERRYLPEQGNKQISKRIDQEVTLEAPRPRKDNNNQSRRVTSRIGSVKKGSDQYLDVNTGPSVFSGTTENSRSRTGRKIHTTYTDKELKKELPVSRRFNSNDSTNNSRRNHSSRGSRKDAEGLKRTTENSIQLTESESIRVDIPFILSTTDYPKFTTSNSDTIENNQHVQSRSSSRNAERRNDDREYSRSNVKESKNSDRMKNRRKSNDEVGIRESNSRSVQSRRGSSKFVDFTTSETIETVTTVRSKNRNEGRSLDRSRNIEKKSRNSGNESGKSRTRDRSLDIVSRSVSDGVSGQAEIKRRSSGDRNSRNPEIRSRSVDAVQDQDNRGRSRGRVRVDSTTAKIIDIPTAVPIETTTGISELTTLPIPETSISITRSIGQRESVRTITDGSSSSRNRQRIRAVSQGGRNTTKEDFFNHGLGFRGRKFPIDEVTTSNPNKPSTSTNVPSAQIRGNPGWTLRRRPGHLDKIESTSSSTTVKEQINEIVSSDDRSTTIVPTTRRGSKKLKNDEITTTLASTTKNSNPRRINKNLDQVNPGKELEESDNYPPDFKARLSQLKNSNPKIPVTMSTPRTSTTEILPRSIHLQGKKTSSVQFSERSKMKLELARRLVKPELNEEENVLDSKIKSRTTDMPIAEETKKVDKLAKVSKLAASRVDDDEDQRKLEKLSKDRQGQDMENSDQESRTTLRQKKGGRVVSERTVTSISVDKDSPNYVVETVTKVTEEVSSMMIDGSLLKNPTTRKTKSQELSSITSKPVKGFNVTPRNAVKGFKTSNFLARRNKSLDRDSLNGSARVLSGDRSRINPSTTTFKPNKQQSSSTIEYEDNRTKKPRMLNSVTKANFQSRYPKKLFKETIIDDTNEIPQQTTSRSSSVTNRYSRKKVDIYKPFDPVPKTIATVSSTSKRREFRPRTATYRRHSEIPTTLVQSTSKVDPSPGVSITPKTPKYHATLKSSSPTARSIPQEPQVSVRISNDTSNSIESGITDSSNGNTGSSNIFNPTRSAFLSGNTTLLEQLRSTVAPLLNSLGNKTPIFAESYSNVNSGSSTPRITPNGSPPRFSARYKGAELFVRKSTGYQATVPSITSSSTTQITPIEDIGSALPPPIDISSPGEPKFLTYYQALESASIQNEQQGNSQQERLNDTVTQVDSNSETNNGTNGNANSNNDTTSPMNVETASPQTPNTTTTTTTTTQPDNLMNETLSQDMENPAVTTEGLPESLNVSMTVEPTESMSTIPDSMIETNTTTTELSNNVTVVEEMSTTQESPISTDQIDISSSIPDIMDTSSSTPDIMDTSSSTPTMEPTSTVVTSMNDILTTTVTQSSDLVETMSSSTDESSTMEPITTEVANNTVTIPTSTTQNVENSSAVSDGTTMIPIESTASQTLSTTSAIETSTENIESNTIEQSDVTSSTSESNDLTSTIITTTDQPIVTTIRTRLIDFAQEILARLQNSLGGSTLPPTTSPAATTEIPTSTSDLDTNTISNNSVESTTMRDIVQQQEMTTISDDVTSVSMNVSTQEAVGFNDSETNTLETVENNSTTDPSTTANAESSDLISDVESLTQPVTSISPENESSVNTTPESPINSTEMTTLLSTNLQDSTLESTITNDPNDTLLTELMTIAKSLFSEGMNETSLQTRPDNISSIIDLERNLEDIESSLTTDSSTTINDSTTENVPDFTTEVPSEQVDTTTIRSEREEDTTLTVDLSENEINSTPLSPTTITNIELVDDSLAFNVTENEVEFVQTNDTSFELGTTLENIETTGTTDSIENEIGTVPIEEFENITESFLKITQDPETTTVSTADFESTTLSYNFQSTTTQTQITTPVESIDISISSTPSMVGESLTTTTTMVNDDQSSSTRNPVDIDTEIPASITETTLSSANIELLTQSTVTIDSSSTNLVSTESMSTVTITEPTATTEVVTNNDDITTSQVPEIIITETITEQALDESIENNRTNQTIELTTTEMVVNDTEVTTNPPLLTNDTDLLDLTNITGTITTNQPPIETTTTLILTDPSSSPPDFMSTTPNFIDRLQDTTPATAQGTAATETMQFDQMNETTIIPTTIITESPTTTTSDSSTSLITESSPSSGTSTTSIDTTTLITTTMTTMTTTTMTPTTTTMTTPASPTTTNGPSETTTAMTTTMMSTMQPTEDNIDINDNLISTEASTSISTMPASTTLSPDISNTISRMDGDVETTTMELTTETTSTSVSSSTVETTTPTTPSTTSQQPTTSSSPVSPSTIRTMFTSPYVGRFGGSRLTPAPRFSPSSSTKAPLRDYHVYGIYPNKTIVRKRPEDNLIDARNVDSPYVIFGIYPDGRLVRKFPNGTIIPDPPSNPVEVVFSLSTTTTTNRPPPVFFYNQANQGTFNQYQAPSYYNNRRPVANLMTNAQNFGTVDLGLTGNAISGSNGGGADFLGPLGTPGSVATTNTMGSGQNGISGVGRIIQDRQRDEGSRSRESAGQRNSVYIGQDRFVNYWTNGAPSTNPRVVSVNINSVASATNEGPGSSSRIPSFDNLLNGQSNGGQVTAPPGFPWRDPLDQIFGITTNSPVITASIASNTLDDSNESNPSFDTRPVNPFVEVFTPASGVASSSLIPEMATSTATTVASTSTIVTTTPASTTTTTTTPEPTTTTTTTPAPTTTTTTTTTTPAPTTTTTTTTTTPAPTTTTTTTTTTPAPTTTTTTTTTPAPTTTTTTTTTPAPTTTTTTTTTPAPEPTTTTTTTLAPTTIMTTMTEAPTTVTSQATTPINMRTQNAFGTTFDDLAFLNSLLQPNDGPTTQKTLNDVEKLLANKILSLALNNVGPTRSPKAIQLSNVSEYPNFIQQESSKASSSLPIIIDLLPSSTSKPSTISSSTSKPITTTPTIIKKPVKVADLSASAQTYSASVSSSTTKSPIIVTAKSIPSKPRTTTPAPVKGLGASLLEAIFGGNFFGPSTTIKPVKSTTKPIKTTPRVVEITQRPIVTTQSSVTPRMVKISEIVINTTKPTTSTTTTMKPTTSTTTTVKPITTTTRVLLNNPNPRLPNVISSTYSPEDDAKFLSALFNSLQQSNKKNPKSGTPVPTSSLDDEAFLRAILSGQAKVPLVTTTKSPEINNAALLAALLKAQGIEPSTPATNLREQLQLASLEKNLVSLPPSTSTSQPITARPISTTTARQSTFRPKSIQTTTWSPSSTYPPPLFSGLANFVNPLQDAQNNNGANGESGRNQVVNVALGATRAFSQFLGAAITGAAQQLQSFVRNGTRIVSEAVG